MLYLCFIKFKQHDMTTAKKIYNKLTAMNPISTYASSFGSHTSHFAQECADMVRSEILEFVIMLMIAYEAFPFIRDLFHK